MGKVITKEEYLNIKKLLKLEHKKVSLCHGVFDLVHPGHIIHFEEAKSLGDVLVVSVTASTYVRKGPGRPYFDDAMRLKFLEAIACIDYVMLSESNTVDDIIAVVEPNWYVKGQEYAKAEDDITGMISKEEAMVRDHGGVVYYTSGEVFSSTRLINKEMPVLSNGVKDHMLKLKQKYSFEELRKYVNKFEDLKVLVVGDTIIDEYVYCGVQGLMSKDMGYSTRYKRAEQYLGGSLAVARHLASFTSGVTMMSVIGNESDIHSMILNELGHKMRVDFEYSNVFKTIIKTRYITENEKREELNKIFAINNLPTPMIIDYSTMQRFKAKLRECTANYDVVVLCDFGHGLVDQEVINILQDNAKYLTVNCQTNSSNYGLSLITKYTRLNMFALDEKEIKLALANESLSDNQLLVQLSEKLGASGFLTQGSSGATAVEKREGGEHELYACPALTLQIKDTIGAGDAFFSLVSLCTAIDIPYDLSVFMGNIAGALAANITGNKDSIDKINVLKYANTLLNI